MYIMCVIFCLFRALSCGEDALQIPIIIIKGFAGHGSFEGSCQRLRNGSDYDPNVPGR